jgi:hypothetical protein
LFPLETKRVVADDRRALLQWEANEILAESFGESEVHLVIHEPHSDLCDAGRPFANFNAVEGIDIDQ